MQFQCLSKMTLLFVTCQLFCKSAAEYLLHTFSGKIGAGNYTYYKLTREGYVRLFLETLQGDSDMYISDRTLMPDYGDYEVYSATCGEDELTIPYDFKRPVGIGVYGHPTFDTSKFELRIYVEGKTQGSGATNPNMGNTYQSHSKEEDESILWTIFVGILKIIFDILL